MRVGGQVTGMRVVGCAGKEAYRKTEWAGRQAGRKSGGHVPPRLMYVLVSRHFKYYL